MATFPVASSAPLASVMPSVRTGVAPTSMKFSDETVSLIVTVVPPETSILSCCQPL